MIFKKQKSRFDRKSFYFVIINKQKQLVELSKIAKNIGYTLIKNVLVTQVNISNKILLF